MSFQALWVCLNHFDHSLVPYLAPKNTPLGHRVLVPFGQKELIGLSVKWNDCHLPNDKVKKIKQVLDDQAILTEDMLYLAQCVHSYYHTPLNQILLIMFQTYLKKDWFIKTSRLYDLQDNLFTQATTNQQKKLSKLGRKNHLTSYELLQQGISSKSLSSWHQKGLIQESSASFKLLFQLKNLNDHQKSAFNDCHLEGFHVNLLQGITGSGKTEIYLHAMLKPLQKRQTVLMLVPEIGLTPQTHLRLLQAYQCPVLMIHSQINPTLRSYLWSITHSEQPLIILGTRSAALCDIPHLGLIIIDEEHDASFIHDQGAHYDARHVALFRAQHKNIPVIMGSATPSLHALHNAQLKKYHWIQLNHRHHHPMPKTSIIDCRGHRLKHGLAPMTQSLLTDLIKNQKQQVLLFINRRGFAPITLCHTCGFRYECTQCDVNMTFHQKQERLVCHHCLHSIRYSPLCPECQKETMVHVGIGTEQLAKACQDWFPDEMIIRIDRDTAQRVNHLNELTHNIHNGKAKILIGTQMIAKGHDFPHLNHVIMVDIDQGFYAADYRAGEHLMQMAIQVAGRCGRHQQQGHVYLQTYLPHHALMPYLTEGDYSKAAQHLLKERQQHHLPPITFQASITAKARSISMACQVLDWLKPFISHQDVSCIGPFPALTTKRQGEYRYQLLITAKARHTLHQSLRGLPPSLTNNKQVSVWLSVDPNSA